MQEQGARFGAAGGGHGALRHRLAPVYSHSPGGGPAVASQWHRDACSRRPPPGGSSCASFARSLALRYRCSIRSNPGGAQAHAAAQPARLQAAPSSPHTHTTPQHVRAHRASHACSAGPRPSPADTPAATAAHVLLQKMSGCAHHALILAGTAASGDPREWHAAAGGPSRPEDRCGCTRQAARPAFLQSRTMCSLLDSSGAAVCTTEAHARVQQSAHRSLARLPGSLLGYVCHHKEAAGLGCLPVRTQLHCQCCGIEKCCNLRLIDRKTSD